MAALAKALLGGYLPVEAEGAVPAKTFCVWINPTGESGYVVGPPAADSDAWAGVSDAAIADEGAGEIAIDGIVNILIHDTIATGDEIMICMTAGHEGKGIPATTGKQVCAIACQEGVQGDTIAVRLCRYIKP